MSRGPCASAALFLALTLCWAGIGTQGGPQVDTVLLCSAEGAADCSIAAHAARRVGAPVLSLDGALGPTALRVLSRMGPRLVVLVGGPAVLPPSIEGSLEGEAETVRLWGATAAGTSVEVSRFFWNASEAVAVVREGDLGSLIRARNLGPVPLLFAADGVPGAVVDEVLRLGALAAYAPGLEPPLGVRSLPAPAAAGRRAVVYCAPMAAATAAVPVRPGNGTAYLPCEDAPAVAERVEGLDEVEVVGGIEGTEGAYGSVMEGVARAVLSGRGPGPLVRRELVTTPSDHSAGLALEDLAGWSMASRRPAPDPATLAWLRGSLSDPSDMDAIRSAGPTHQAWEAGWRARGAERLASWASLAPEGRAAWCRRELAGPSEHINTTPASVLFKELEGTLAAGVELLRRGDVPQGMARVEGALELVRRARRETR